MGYLLDPLWTWALLVMTDKQWLQLVAPLVAGLGFFALALIWGRTTGDLNRDTWKALLASGGLISYAGYLTLWQNEIKSAWNAVPLLVILGLGASAIVPIGLFYWIWQVQAAAKRENAQVASTSTTKPKIASTGSKVFRTIVLVWGIANLLGLVVAIIHAFLHTR